MLAANGFSARGCALPGQAARSLFGGTSSSPRTRRARPRPPRARRRRGRRAASRERQARRPRPGLRIQDVSAQTCVIYSCLRSIHFFGGRSLSFFVGCVSSFCLLRVAIPAIFKYNDTADLAVFHPSIHFSFSQMFLLSFI